MKQMIQYLLIVLVIAATACKKDDSPKKVDNSRTYYKSSEFVMGADLSYVNQILDKGGVYLDSGKVEDPYSIFRKYGTNVVRFRLWHTPQWTADVYLPEQSQMYNDYADTKLGIQRSKAAGMEVCLDFHYSDTWADPGKQITPEAWKNLSLTDLRDSLYNYTYKTLIDLNSAGLMPEYVQVGNEINPGLLLPQGARGNNNEANMITLLNGAIKAVRDAAGQSTIKPQIIIHIAQPENVTGWFNGLAAKGLTDFDIVGVSYYYMWSSVALESLSNYIALIKSSVGKEVMVVETAYPWTTGYADSYGNIMNVSKLLPDYPATPDGQYRYIKKVTSEIIEGGGKGIMYWEPAWITSQLKTQWGQGSAWEPNTYFDFQGNVIKVMDFMTDKYNLK